MEIADDLESLTWFTDAIDAGMACEYLAEAEILFEIKDHSVRPVGTRQRGSGVRMEIRVQKKDVEQAKVLLREKMHLFPFPENAEEYEDASEDDDEVLSEAILCDTQPSAEEAKSTLNDAGIWSIVQRIVDNNDGTVFYSVQVKGKDIERAIQVVEQWAETREAG